MEEARKPNERFYNKKTGKPLKILKCNDCGKRTLELDYTDRTFISGDLHVYECSNCKSVMRVIL